MKIKLILFIAFILISKGMFSENISPVGKWKTYDDEDGRLKSIVEIWEENEILFGKIIELFRLPDEDPNPICDECKGKNKDKLILDMTILWEMKPKSNKWKGGKILDPDNGKIYKCKIEVIDNGKRLEVRGFLGISLLGRTQYWEKVE